MDRSDSSGGFEDRVQNTLPKAGEAVLFLHLSHRGKSLIHYMLSPVHSVPVREDREGNEAEE